MKNPQTILLLAVLLSAFHAPVFAFDDYKSLQNSQPTECVNQAPFSLSLEKVKEKLAAVSTTTDDFTKLLLEDYTGRLTNPQGETHYVIPYAFLQRDRSFADYEFNKFIVVDEDYNLRDLRVFATGLPNKKFDTRVLSFLSAFLNDRPVDTKNHRLLTEYTLQGDFMQAYKYAQVDALDTYWQKTELIFDKKIIRDDDNREKLRVETYLTLAADIPEPELVLTEEYFTQSTDFLTPVAPVATALPYGFLPNTQTNIDYTEEIALLKSYQANGEFAETETGSVAQIYGRFIKEKIQTIDSEGEVFCTFNDRSAATYVIGGTDELSFLNIQAGPVGLNRAFHSWSAKVACTAMVPGSKQSDFYDNCFGNSGFHVHQDYAQTED